MTEPINPSKPMPIWLRQILDAPSLLSSFIEDLNERGFRATSEGVRLSKQGKHDEANVKFGRAEAYESLLSTAMIHQREQESQNAFQQKQKPGSGKSAKSHK